MGTITNGLVRRLAIALPVLALSLFSACASLPSGGSCEKPRHYRQYDFRWAELIEREVPQDSASPKVQEAVDQYLQRKNGPWEPTYQTFLDPRVFDIPAYWGRYPIYKVVEQRRHLLVVARDSTRHTGLVYSKRKQCVVGEFYFAYH